MAPSKGAQLVGFSLVDMMGKCVQVEYFWQILLFLLILILYEFIWDIWGHMVPKADKGIFHLIFTISCKIKIMDFFSLVDMMGKCVQVEYFWQILLFLLILILYEFIWDIWGHMVPKADKGIFHLIFTISCKIKIMDFFSLVDMMGKCVQVE